MNKQIREQIKVGAIFIVVVALLFTGISFLRGFLNSDRHINILYSDAQGLQKGEIIQMAGVAIGQVDDVRLTPDSKRALVRVSVRKTNRVPLGSRFVIKSGVLGNQHTLTVEPNLASQAEIADEATVEGEATSNLDSALAQSQKLIPKIEKLLTSFQKTASAFEKITSDPIKQKRLDNTLKNVEETTANLPIIERQVQSELATLSLQANQLLAGLQTTKKNADVAAANVAGLTGDFRDTLKENRGNLRALIRDADEAVSGVAGLTEQAKTTLGDKKLQANLTQATDNLVSISARLDAITSDIQRISGDPRLTTDLRETLTNVKETSQSIRNLTARLEGLRLPGEKRPAAPPDPNAPPPAPRYFSATSLLEPSLVFDGAYDTDRERLRTDVNYTLLTGKKSGFYRVGIADFTEGNKLNLQIGQANGSPATFAYRYGIVAGKLGGGFDTRTGPLDLRLDLYDPNRFTVNARAKSYLNKDSALTFGVNSVGHGNRATVGFQIRK